MAKKTNSGKKRAPFTQRVVTKLTKLQEWTEKTKARFASEPKGDVASSLADLEEGIAGALDNLGKINGWAPPSRGPAFVVGDEIAFKKEALAELKKSGLYDDGALDGAHEVLAVAGRKVKIEAGVFANVLISKAA